MELRKIMELEQREPIEIFVYGSSIILQKYQPDCIFCKSTKDMINYKGKNVCKSC